MTAPVYQYDLVWAAFNGDLSKVRDALKEPEVAVDGTDEDGSTPLTAAAWGGHLDIVKLLLENGANIEAANNTHGWNALMSAGSRGHGDVVEFLLQKNANSLVLDLHDTDAETYARQNKHYGVADTLKAAMVKQRAAGFTPTSKPATSHWSCTDSCAVS